jgi:phosphoribosylformylglycinamidine synthase subunit PurL
MAEILKDTSVPDPPSDELLHKVGLTREEYERACKIVKRKLNVVEMGIFGAMWSEHCCYKTSKRYLKTFPTTGPRVLQGPGENAGVMDLGNDYAVVFKIESHNHPSAVEPFQGATTGVGGIIRDIFAMGARPIALLDSLRFGNPYPVAPVGQPPQVQADAAAEEAAVPVLAGPQIPWTADPPPYVCSVSWMTTMRRPLLERGPVARKAIQELRKLHGKEAEVLAYCILPDSIGFVAWLKDGGEEHANEITAVLKATLGLEVADLVPEGQKPFEPGARIYQHLDQTRVDEAIKRLEYTPVQRGTVKQIKDFPFVSSVWKYGVAWPDATGGAMEQPQTAPYCPGVTGPQAARNRFLVHGVVSGIAHYGNCIGIPTVGGEVAFDPTYTNNCLVNAMCAGIVRKNRILKGVAHGPGNSALIVGAKTGRDGVQGATFASVDLPEDYAQQRPAVQVGDPFMEKLLLEATLEIMHLDGLVGVQDFGAAGLTCSCVEMAARAGTGMRLDLDKVPQRAKDLSAYEMMLSESQERMMVVVEAGKEQPFLDVFKKWGLTAVHCGEVLPDKRVLILHHGQTVADLPNLPLAEDGPDYDRPYEEPSYYVNRKPASDADIGAALERINDLGDVLSAGGQELPSSANRFEHKLRHLLRHPSIASKHPVFQQYDHMVRTNTVLGPGAGDAAVVRIKETGQALALATDGSGRHVFLDPKLGGARAVLESARNVVAVGATPLGITNCLNFGNPEKLDRMWQFVQSVAGMREALGELTLPVTGGNVSFYNETAGAGVLPTPVVGMFGLLEDAAHYVPGQAREAGLELYVLGAGEGCLDGSALLFDLGRFRGGELPAHDYRAFRDSMRFLLKAIEEKSVTACHDISDGGLLTAIVEMCQTGAKLDLAKLLPDGYDDEDHNKLAALFGEEGHRWLLAVTKQQRGWLRTAALHYQVSLTQIGETVDGTLAVAAGNDRWLECGYTPLRLILEHGLADWLKER